MEGEERSEEEGVEDGDSRDCNNVRVMGCIMKNLACMILY